MMIELFKHLKDKVVLPSHLEWRETKNSSQISMALAIKDYTYSQVVIITHNLDPVNHDNVFVVNFFKPDSGGNCASVIPFADPELILKLLDHVELAIRKQKIQHLRK
jgi:hypothetical protein